MKILKNIHVWLLVLILAFGCVPTGFAAAANANTYVMPYYIEVDIANQITTVYSTADNSVVRQMICTTGMGSRTPRGTYIMPPNKYAQDRQEWYYFPEFHIYAKYASRIIQGILFHSILFSHKGATTPTWASQHSLGSKASHGCIRLRVPDAKWIAENCFAGTQVRMYDDGERDEELRALLKIATYSVDDGVSYEAFLGGAVTMAKGAKLDNVTKLQEKLNELGYDCGKPDGEFGSRTENAVLAWQKDYGYEETGVVPPAMMEIILSAEPTVTPEPTPTPNVEAVKGDTAVVVQTKTWLNVRETPSVNGKLIGTLKVGEEVTVIEQDEEWSQIVYKDSIGYASNAFLKITATREPEPSATPAPEASEEPETTVEPETSEEPETEDEEELNVEAKVTQVSTWLNVRSKASASSSLVRKIYSHAKVTITGVENGWAHIIMDDGKEGWVMLNYLDYDKELIPIEEATEPEGTLATVNSDTGLILRRSPDENSGQVTTLSKGQEVYIQEEVDDQWVKIYARGFTGYAAREFLTVKEEEAAA